MSTKDEIESAVIRTPKRGEVYQLAGTAGTQVFAAPASWKGKKVRFEAIGDSFWIQTAPDATIAITPTQTVSIGGGPGFALTTSNAIAERVAMDTYKEFDFTEADAFVGFRGNSTSGYLLFRETETALGSN